MNLNVFIKFVLCSKTNKDKSTKIITPLLLKPTDISARAMTRAKNSQQKLTILKKATGLCLTRSYYILYDSHGLPPPNDYLT